ncbi:MULTISPECIES: DNA topoisomerase IV subunit A [Ureibacillus]|uniref:DNA topoisomerase 4 subunit A n=1 Tax=Ureibacillus thermosphaericus TaxID=51173 RepID=A0A840PM97_URETH|nr:DNA topoisomerase IV subunit A [Ureibacillus thermosphaericus]MBB5149535.1 topoisomerase-4 subunit A [Ureibacillus thermosphaericus]NKZ32418.1 DNA topoisomerase IV subunit A [Ureibacillus thermosphaericus]
MASTERFHELTLEDVIGDRFSRYSKYIIQDRAIPDARDGLKPVQRRILYAMYREGNTHEKPFRKSAKTVGNVIGNYHPHGDSSVYEAMVRLSQDWKARYPLIEMHGNNGSVDGDPPAAMRYTEARLSVVAAEMLKDIDKQTVDFVPNFDDQDTEPTVLPAKLPNLLVNGATGISAGYATDIPPHNLSEVLDGILMRLDHPNCTVDDLMTVIKGPDFPTGAIIEGIDGIKKAYETGKGKIIIRSKATIEPIKGGKEQIVITEIPYDVNKAQLVKKIDEMRFDKRLEGIADIRDESDRTAGLRIVIELKKDIDGEAILNYLYKNTDLQITYNFNMIAIHNRRPTMMTLPLMLDAYIDHQKDVVTRRTKFDLQKAKDRLHIVEGLIKALSILDDVIQTIRSSKDKRDAKNNLQSKFQFTEAQAEAIVNLQLYRLTNTDITQLQKEHEELQKTTEKLSKILSSEKELIKVIKKEIQELRKKFDEPRRSTIQAEIKEIKLSLDVLVPSEDVVVTVTKDGYVKRTSLRSYAASSPEDIAMKESDYLLFEETLNTQHYLLIFTNKGNYIYQPVHELPDIRWKDLGQHISSIVPIEEGEKVIGAIGVENFDDENLHVLTASKQGQVKRSSLAEYQVSRYSKPIKSMNLKNDDEMIYANLVSSDKDVILTSYLSYTVRFNMEEIPITGVKTGGVKGINLKDDDILAAVNVIEKDAKQDVLVVTHRGAIKRMSISEIERTGRAKRGLVILKELKTNPHRIFNVLVVNEEDSVLVVTKKQVQEKFAISELTKADRYSNGSLKFDINNDGELLFVKILKPIQEVIKDL